MDDGITVGRLYEELHIHFMTGRDLVTAVKIGPGDVLYRKGIFSRLQFDIVLFDDFDLVIPGKDFLAFHVTDSPFKM